MKHVEAEHAEGFSILVAYLSCLIREEWSLLSLLLDACSRGRLFSPTSSCLKWKSLDIFLPVKSAMKYKFPSTYMLQNWD
jgi:hypothetical protein